MDTFDTIVIGAGGMGSATLFSLAQRGQRVLGLEQYALGHSLGSSHGQTRIIRQAYFEHPDYVPLLQHAYVGWEALAETTEDEILNLCGLLLAGREDDLVIRGTRESATQHGLPLEKISALDAEVHYPGFRLAGSDTGLHDPLGGYLRVEACVTAFLDAASTAGATLRANEPVLEWQVNGQGVEVRTATNTYRAGQLVLCAGAWSGELLRTLGLPLTVRRVVTAWFPPENDAYRVEGGCPVFAFQTPHGFFYGFPQLDGRGVKLACHEPGGHVDDPAVVDRAVSAQDLTALQAFARAYLPGINLTPNESSVCLYTMTPDSHFIVDRHPEYEQVCFAAGFSGHGFKFCPAIGDILADFATNGSTELPCEFLGHRRLQ
jgi:sarcosine oxidase